MISNLQRNLGLFSGASPILRWTAKFLFVAFSFLFGGASSLIATSATWNGTTSTAWALSTNWSGIPVTVPGSGNTATFNNAGNGNTTLNLGLGVTINTVLFDTSSAASYTIGSGAVGSQTLTLNDSGAITVNSTVTSDQTINANVVLGLNRVVSTYSFTNNSTSPGQLLTVAGNVSLATANGGGPPGIKTLALGGSGNGLISGNLSETPTNSLGGAITKSGTGTWTLTGSSDFSQATTVSAGVLNIQNATALGTTAAGTSVTSGATLQIQGGITVGAEALTLNGSGASGQNGALVNVSGTNNYGGLITLGSATTISSDSGTLNLTNTGTITGATFGLTLTGSGNGSVSSVIGTTSGSLTKSGSGSWTLTGASTYTGATSVNAGTLKLGVANALSGTSGITVNNSGSLALGANNTINDVATMKLNGNVTTNNPSTKNLVVTNSEGSSTTSSATAGLGSLTLQSRSTLDFLQSTSTIVFGQTGGTAFVDASSFKLDIYNYIGDSTPTGNLDHLVFQQDMSSLTGDFEFWDGSAFVAATATQLGASGFWEITPLTAVPEPSTWLASVLALGAIGFLQRKRVRACVSFDGRKHS